MKKTLQEIASVTGGVVQGDPSVLIERVSGIVEAGAGDITFISNPKYVRHLDTTNASAVICSPDITHDTKTLLKVEDPYLAFAKTVALFHPAAAEPGRVDERAVIGEQVSLGRDVTVYPFVYISDGAVIGDRVTIYPHCFIGKNTVIGEGCFIYPNVTIRQGCVLGRRVIVHPGTVIGSDGFGYAKQGAAYYKIPQVGGVRIDDDVEIGACNTIDRAALGTTWIKRGTKIDNLVHIAHNVVVGEDCALVAQVGISGSTTLGNRVTLAGQVGTIGHISIGDDVVAGPKTGISRSIASGEVVFGYPHIPYKEWLKSSRVVPRLPEMRNRIREMENRISELENCIDQLKRE